MIMNSSLPLCFHHQPTILLTSETSTAFFYGQESPAAVEFHKSNAIDGRLTEVEDIAPIFKFLCTEGAWINGTCCLFLIKTTLEVVIPPK